MSGPRGVRRRSKGGREAVVGTNQAGAEVRWRRISWRRTPEVVLEGREGRGSGSRRPDGGGRKKPGRAGCRDGGGREGDEVGGRRRGYRGEGAARFPSPNPGPGLPLTQPHGVGRLDPDSQCARRLRRRRRGRGQAAGTLRLRLRLRPAAPGRRVLAEAAAVSGFNAQRLRGTRALRRRDAATAVSPSGAGPGHPPSPR